MASREGEFIETDLIKLRAFLRQQAAEDGLSIRQWCLRHKISEGHVSEFLSGKGRPGPKLLKALGFRLVWTIEPATRGRPTTTKNAA